MPEISNLTRPKITSTTIDLGDGDTVTIQFDRNRVSPDWVAEAERRDQERDTLSLPRALADVVTGWDVTQDGQPFEPSPDNLAVLSYAAQSQILREILRAAVPGEAEGKASSAPTSTPPLISAEPPPTSQNGPAASPSPEPSTSPSPT